MFQSNQWIFTDKDNQISLQKWQKTVDLMSDLFAAPAGFIVQAMQSGYRVVIASEQQDNPYTAGTMIPLETNIFCKKVVQDNHSLYVNNASNDEYWHDNPEVSKDGFESYLGLPIHWPNGDVFGTLCVMDFEQTDYQRNYLELIKQLRDMIEDDLFMVNSFVQMREIAMLDPLTHIYNRRAVSILSQQKLNLAQRLGFEVCCLFIDVNDFKLLNDTHGHEVGDKALVALAATLKECLREADIIGRLGGDEFVVVLQTNDTNEPLQIKAKIVQGYNAQLAKLSLPPLSISIGYGFAEHTKETFEILLNKADKDMYKNKLAFKAGQLL
ncbi:diguanylate cyclase [Pseudoalteromonas porphyrae]|uniref:sensor domain-containing diguanylate cyclase n=1 Tax=Pseudoalteromonas TaxID=53246 RepID=UPI0006BADD10|nr:MULTISPECIES: sensor domain-containing diguanylate cyclase [Pseudoalteromonas]KPH95367.1 diguanylate cyclase [Pseudoalteromonas porphyrae]NNG42010.1 sensor domain-containing diguanylate cyclase [Pseudoalteromonas sp. NEC-BIFX-2020_002]